MPLIKIIPSEARKIKLRNNLKTPVYVTQNRKNVKGEGFVYESDLRPIINLFINLFQPILL